MKYSIIIPVLNEERLLPTLLEQICKKDLKEKFDYEVIISDGGSTDKTIEIALPLADVITIHDGTEKQNIAMGRNQGAKFASGSVLVFINGDILFEDIPAFFNHLDNYFFNSSYIAFTCNVKVFPHEETRLDRIYHNSYNFYFNLLNIVGIGMGRGECQVIKKDAFEKLNGYNERFAAGEDFDLFRRLKKIGKILFSKNIIVFESPRRFRKFGYLAVTTSWVLNGFSVMWKDRSISTEWRQVR